MVLNKEQLFGLRKEMESASVEQMFLLKQVLDLLIQDRIQASAFESGLVTEKKDEED